MSTIALPTGSMLPTIECPSWCENRENRDGECRGEHHSMNVGDGPVSATGGLPSFSNSGAGVYFPTVTVALSWDTIDNLQPSVSLWINSEHQDEQADLLLHEAKALLAELTRAVAILEAQR